MAKKKAAAETSSEDGKKAGNGKLMMIGGAAVAVLALGGGAWFFLMSGPKESSATMAKAEMVKKTAFVDLPEMTINLSANQQERQQFLKVRIALEVGDPKLVPEITTVMPRVMDTFQVYLREMRAVDFEGSAQMYRIKEELMRRVNVAVYPSKIDAVLLKEALVQ